MAQYPSAAGTDANLFLAVNNLSCSLSDNPLSSGATTINVSSTTGFPTTGFVTIDAECIQYTGTTGTTFTGCTRGAAGTAAASHLTASQVQHTVVADHHNVLKDEIKAIEADLVATLAAITPATAGSTASSVLNRLAQVVNQIKNGFGLTNWYDTVAAMLPATSARPVNILDNGGFEIAQRGITFSNPADAAFTLDRWKTNTNEAATVTVTQDSTTIDTGLLSMKAVLTGSGASKYWYASQNVENYAEYRGKTVTLSVRVNANTASAFRVAIYDGVTTTYSSYHTGGSSFETLSVTATIGASVTSLQVQIGMAAAGDKKNGTYYWDSAMFTVGSTALSFIPDHPQTALARCQRYYQRIGGHSLEVICSGQCYTTTQTYLPLKLIVPMRAAPTITVTAPTHFGIWTAAAAVNACATVAADAGASTTYSAAIGATVASGLVAGNATTFTVASGQTDAIIEFTADI